MLLRSDLYLVLRGGLVLRGYLYLGPIVLGMFTSGGGVTTFGSPRGLIPRLLGKYWVKVVVVGVLW